MKNTIPVLTPGAGGRCDIYIRLTSIQKQNAETTSRSASNQRTTSQQFRAGVNQQLVLYADMTPSTTPVEERKVILSDSASATLDRFIDACSSVVVDASCVASGRKYIAAMTFLMSLQKGCYHKCGPYTSARIARAILFMFGCVKYWGKVTVRELREVSADQGEFLSRFNNNMLVTDLAAKFGCPGELVSMYACLGVIN